MTTLGPIWLKIEDCGDCPHYDGDWDYSECTAEDGAKHLPIYRKVDQKIIPPKDCPLRKLGSRR